MTSESGPAARQRALWGTCGDYPAVAPLLAPVADELVARLAPAPGNDLLDVATGTGNVALRAARSGARVTAADLTPELLAAARRRVGAERVTWVEADALELPFEPASFDLVTSSFGVMFAPDHARAAAELVRVCRPGGRIAVCAWTPEGYAGRWSSVGARWVPEFAAGPSAPTRWGDPEHVAELFSERGVELTFDYATLGYRFPSLEAFEDFMEANSAPYVILARAARAAGDYEECRRALLELAAAFDAGGAAGCNVRSVYLVTVARRVS